MAREKQTRYRLNGRIRWDRGADEIAMRLAQGYTGVEVANQMDISDTTVYNLMRIPEFADEVDRLTLMTDIATKAHRLRLAKAAIRQFLEEREGKIVIKTKADLLEWLKYAQSETDGVRLDLSQFFAAIAPAEVLMAGGESARILTLSPDDDDDSEGETEAAFFDVAEDEV